MAAAKVKLGVRWNQFQLLIDLCRNVVTHMTGNPNFATPTPTLASVTTQTDATEVALNAWGPEGNRGSHADYVALVAAAQALYNLISAEASYVQTTSGGDPDIIMSSGFSIKNAGSPQGPLGVPQDIQQMFSNTISIYTPKLKWKKPIGLTSPNNVKSYEIFRSGTPVFTNAVLLDSVTKTSFVDTTAAHGNVYYYFVRGINAAGAGAETAALFVSTPL